MDPTARHLLPRRAPVLVSAHRCNTLDEVRAALRVGADHVEVDVHRTPSGRLVLAHDAPHDDVDHPLLDDALALLAPAEVSLHLDLKQPPTPGPDGCRDQLRAVEATVAALGPERVVVTTLDDDVVRAVRDWADAQGIALLVGLSLGREVSDRPWTERMRTRWSEVVPHQRYAASRANVVVVNHRIARLGVAGFARRRGLPLLVWTVDGERPLRYWTRPGRAFLVTSNQPDRAVAARDEHAVRRDGRRVVLRRVGRAARAERAERPRRADRVGGSRRDRARG